MKPLPFALLTSLAAGAAVADTVIFDGKKVIEAADDSFSDAGKVGIWTKAGSVTIF